MADAQQQLKIEEFRQLHEHIRTFETALSTIFTVSLVACTTLLTAIVSLFFSTYRADPSKIEVAVCYLFLIPAFLSVVTLALMSSYKTAIYRNGYYIKVFFEEGKEVEGARWHVNLAEYRKLAHGEHGNPAALVLWALHGISIAFFIHGLLLIRPRPWHYAMPLPLVGLMIYATVRFMGNRQSIEAAWHRVKDQIRGAPPPEPQSEKSVRP